MTRCGRRQARESGVVLVAVTLLGGLLLLAGLGLIALGGRDLLTMRHRFERQHLRHLTYGALQLVATAVAHGPVADALRGNIRAPGSDPASVVAYTLTHDRVINLPRETAWLTCGRSTPCTETDRRRVSTARPWGPGNPRWVIVLQGPASRWWSGPWHRGSLVVVWAGDDAREVDGDPSRDDATGPATGQGVLRLYAVAYGVSGGRHAIESELVRYCDSSQTGCQPGGELSSLREVDGEL